MQQKPQVEKKQLQKDNLKTSLEDKQKLFDKIDKMCDEFIVKINKTS